MTRIPYIDIHCHLIPEIDDGAKNWDETLKMACQAVGDGTHTIVVTPHQLGSFAQNTGDVIRSRTQELQAFLNDHDVPLTVLPGGDVRIEDQMIAGIQSGDVMTLADKGKHVLLELPHELYFPLEPVLQQLNALGIQGILSHPERNAGIMGNPDLLPRLVDDGCLMQVTAGSLAGSFGPGSQRLAESMLRDGLVHFLASDGHGPKSRRPRMSRGYKRAVDLVGEALAEEICSTNPTAVTVGQIVQPGRRETPRSQGWIRRAA